jgi:ribonuclease J
MPRLYRPDLGGVAGPSPVDLVLVSHAHVDHCGLIGLLRRDVPIATSPQSFATLGSIETTVGAPGWETDYTAMRVRGALTRNDEGEFVRMQYRDERGPERRYITQGPIQEHGKWTIAFHDVDHSIQGANAFVLSDGDRKIVYTGDFRRHGLNPEKTRAFLAAAVEPDVLIMEGTRVGHEKGVPGTDRERDVEAEVRAYIEKHEAQGGPPFIAVGYPPRDLDRLRSLHAVAKSVGRRLLLNTKQAHLLVALRDAGRTDLPDWRSDPHVAVYCRARSSGILRNPGRVPLGDKAGLAIAYLDVTRDEWSRLASKELEGWEFDLLGGEDEKKGSKRIVTKPVPFGDEHIVLPSDVAYDPGEYLFSLSLFNMTDLFDIFPDRSKAGGLYIHSQTQPHNDDMEMDQFRMRRWLTAFNFNAPDHEPRRTHVSGHVSQEDINHILDELRPKLLVPIHSEHPEMSAERYAGRIGRKALLPRWGHPERVA